MAEERIGQKHVGLALGLSHTAISRRTSGDVEFSVGEVEVLADLLGVTEAYLYGFSETRNPRPIESDGGAVRHQGLEPRTRWLTAVSPVTTNEPVAAKVTPLIPVQAPAAAADGRHLHLVRRAS